jgi:phosphatidylglycerophosphate synthase
MDNTKTVDKVIPSIFEKKFDLLVDKILLPIVPSFVKPNHITWVGFIGALFAALAFYLASWQKNWLIAAALGVFIHLVADSLDGIVARKRNLTSIQGYFLDQFLDVLSFVTIFVCIGFSSYAQFEIAGLAAILYPFHMVVILHWIHLKNRWPFPNLGPFEGHISLIILALITLFFTNGIVKIAGYSLGWFDLAMLISTFISFIELLSSAYQLFKQLEFANDN